MADFMQLVSMLREQMNATMSRSDALRPLAWLVGLVATALILLVSAGAAEWLVYWAGIAFLASVGLYGLAFVFCLLIDRDSLRSEKYSLHKMAIEHGIYGDSKTGLIDPRESAPKMIDAPSTPATSEAER